MLFKISAQNKRSEYHSICLSDKDFYQADRYVLTKLKLIDNKTFGNVNLLWFNKYDYEREAIGICYTSGKQTIYVTELPSVNRQKSMQKAKNLANEFLADEMKTKGYVYDYKVGSASVANLYATRPVSGTITSSSGYTGNTYNTVSMRPLSLDTAGLLRVDASGTTQAVSGTVTGSLNTGTFTIAQTAQGTAGDVPLVVSLSPNNRLIDGYVR